MLLVWITRLFCFITIINGMNWVVETDIQVLTMYQSLSGLCTQWRKWDYCLLEGPGRTGVATNWVAVFIPD